MTIEVRVGSFYFKRKALIWTLYLLVKVQPGSQKHTILFDTGYNKIGVLHNMDKLDIDPNETEAIVLSHAHMDHTGSLHAILEKISDPFVLNSVGSKITRT